MPGQKPCRVCSITIPGLGSLTGLEYRNGVRQFCGIPYARLMKRWTRSTLATSWENDFHDGTKLGNDCPMPLDDDEGDLLTPVPLFSHFTLPPVDEKTSLVMNITMPPFEAEAAHPIMVYVHGGSLLYRGANLAIFDAVNIVSHGITLGHPIVCINFNYRVGFGGFLSSTSIQAELQRDGHSGCGNFGFTDQKVAFDWVQKYVSNFGGDPARVTAVGESAGGISISSQLLANEPAVFHRAVCMSGLAISIPAWSLEQHEKLFRAICIHFDIDPDSESSLDKLRALPEQILADATPAIQGVPAGTGNPCIDGWYYRASPLTIQPPPSYLEAYIIGDVYHEGVIFHGNIHPSSYNGIHSTFAEHLSSSSTATAILNLYQISNDIDHDTLIARFEDLAGDIIFKIPNYLTAQRCARLRERGKLFEYHFDTRSTLDNVLNGTAYHAHELLYLFGNLKESMSVQQQAMADTLSAAWIHFVSGKDPWEAGEDTVMIWGKNAQWGLKTKQEDEPERGYKRFEALLEMGGESLFTKVLAAVDEIVNQRTRMGKGSALQ
ncbi:acetylcholinesterase [Leptodontidium sp. MPI-SDFR-AT-0119]|nr:acetylcholinesterase [Leptodontidium sp. MPI-SDFR-AT-0119]